jgi:lysylphosphatidylglycerol synthetase-like protein (DUF2156 family)
MKTNPTIQKAMKVATIAGASVLVVNAVMGLTKASSVRDAVMPLVTILVGVAAFNYAFQSKPTTEVIVKK